MSKKPQSESKPKYGFWRETDRYWFGWHSATTIGIFRILGSFCLLADLFLLSFDFQTWFTERGFVPVGLNETFSGTIPTSFTVGPWVVNIPFSIPRISLLAHVTDARIALLFYLIIVGAGICTLFGWKTRISSIILALGIVSLQHRNMIILHGGDTVMRLTALYIAIAPSGAALSLDRLLAVWRGEETKEPKLVSVWPQRLIQYNLALIYFTTWWLKMDGDLWRNGSAVWFTSRLHEFFRFPYPMFIKSYPASVVLTYATVIIELSMGTLVFYKPARKYVLIGGLLLHATIEYTMNIPMFSFAICSMYVCFYEGEEVSAWAERIKNRIAKLRPIQKRSILAPAGQQFDPAKVAAIEASHPFASVTYDCGDGKSLAVETEDGHPAEWKSWAAGPIGWIPGLWQKLSQAALVEREAVGRGQKNQKRMKAESRN